jgi:hypothetical protein
MRAFHKISAYIGFAAFPFTCGCSFGKCKPVVIPSPVWCAAPQPAPPDLSCPPLLTEADTVRCAMKRDAARAAYAEALAAALKACRKPAQ